MLKTSASLVLGILFVLVGAANVWLVLQASARVKNSKANARLIAAHRIGGYIFIMLFCVMGYFMMARMRGSSGNTSVGTMIHLTVAMLLSPLLFIKVLIARYYKSYYNFLLPIGLLIFVLSFVLVAIAAGPYLLRSTDIRSVSLEEINQPTATVDLKQAATTMQQRCSTCHNLDRVVGARKDTRGWLATVNRMRRMPAAGISEEDVRSIVLFLVSQNPPEQSDPEAHFAVARALITQRCSACHSLDRVYKAAKTPADWRSTVAQMVSNAQSDGRAGAFQPGEDQQIIDFLSATQTPDAVNRRKAQVVAAASAGVSLVIPKAHSPATPDIRAHRFAPGTALSIFGGCLAMAVLIVRRPGRISPPPARAISAGRGLATADHTRTESASPGSPVLLQLVRVTRQTADSRTLRFAAMGNRRVFARPGQFLTFSFLFDGLKVVRSYSICSSPASSGFIEITPKRVEKGSASVFLNDRATLGMTVEASGPFGQFCFDESRHRRIVLIAGGSGITPMMAMLRYIDDLCLPTTVTLLYAVRTDRDIIFESELAELKKRLNNFEYYVVPSQPHPEWKGLHGRLSLDIVNQVVKEPGLNNFFLCGPGPFMDATRGILAALGVAPERITQESFGGAPPAGSNPGRSVAQMDATVEFVGSGKTCSLRQGQTLLEVAEENGVNIPFGCRQGQCGTCKTRLLAGNVTMDAEQGLTPEWRSQGYVLTCVGRADGPVKLDA